MANDMLGSDAKLDKLCSDTIRMLAVDAVEKANSGHPGAPMGLAETAFVVWKYFLRFNPQDPLWPDRDRFILSAGHASMLLYSLLHLFGYELPLEEIENFRQWDSLTPGHPEYHPRMGVEVTTGPLGQGFAHGVGMALGARMMAARFGGDEQFSPVSHRVFGIVSDGDLMEGVSAEAASLAGTLGLGGLIYLYDSNRITIEGSTDMSFLEDVASRFRSYGWFVTKADGYDVDGLKTAITEAMQQERRPGLIITTTVIAKGCGPAEGKEKFHGSPLGEENAAIARETAGFPEGRTFYVPEEAKEHFRGIVKEKLQAYQAWQDGMTLWGKRHKDLAAGWDRYWKREVPENIDQLLLEGLEKQTGATRQLSGKVLQQAASAVDFLVGGSADLAPSTNTVLENGSFVVPVKDEDGTVTDFAGRNLRFGVREHAMAAIVNGLTLYGSFLAYGATFLVFSDYMRPSLRLAALMEIPSIFVFTHDSILLGEDGPTHQPIEQLASLRLIPNLTVIRPADVVETAMAWAWALKNRQGPVLIVLTRQKVPQIERAQDFDNRLVWKGGYVLSRHDRSAPEFIILATGSELWLAEQAARNLREKGHNPAVVSMPSVELFNAQPAEYQQEVLFGLRPPVVVIEAGTSIGWERFAGPDGLILGMDRFGASAPQQELAQRFGFTPDQITEKILLWLKGFATP